MATAAIDFGRKRLGVAVTDDRGVNAYPGVLVERRSMKADLEALRAYLTERDIRHVVVGLPLNMDGSEGPMARSARAFAERLAAATGIPIELYDERLSSFEARERLREATSSRRTRRGVVDVMAAVVILEGWLQRRAGRLGP